MNTPNPIQTNTPAHSPYFVIHTLESAPSEPSRFCRAYRRSSAVDTRGAVTDGEMAEFVAAGFSARQALEVVVGVATYTLSILANRTTRSETVR